MAISNVIIVGGGIAGLACALAAATAKKRVDVFESLDDCNSHSVHVDVGPNFLRALIALGVGSQCVLRGFPYRSTAVVDSRATKFFDVFTERLAPAGFPVSLGIRHGELTRILAEAAASKGATFHWGTPIRAVRADLGGATVELADGSSRRADLVVLADGANSRLRDQALPGNRQTFVYQQTWHYTLVRRPVWLDQATLSVGPPDRKVLMVPLASHLAGLSVGVPSIAGAPADPMDIASLRACLSDFPQVAATLAHLHADRTVMSRPTIASLATAGSVPTAILCVGECAQLLPPHFGQSSAQAVEDAVALQSLLADAAATESPLELVQAFGRRRSDRVRQVFDIVRKAAEWDVTPTHDMNLHELAGRLVEAVRDPA